MVFKKKKQGLTRKLFATLMQRAAPHIPLEMDMKLFRVYDFDGRESLNFAELICCLSTLCVGTCYLYGEKFKCLVI